MKRSEGFFGLHFDFHAGADCTEVGKTVTHEMIREIVETLRPDYIQCDCKGHAGYSSYQTKAGNPAPGFVKDQLKIWREVTAEYGIPLTVHYSGVWDARAIELCPEWAAVSEDGSLNKDMTSTFKGYADGLLIPQLAELANEYGIDAAWVDGECWATVPDFDGQIIDMFEKDSGMKLPRGSYDKQSREYRAFLDFCRAQFFKYLAHYTGEVRRKAPHFEIASNWAFSSHIPQPVCVDVDYLSGDFAPTDSYNSSRFESRVLCEQGKPWDLMAWGFYHDFAQRGAKSIKGADALCREAAGVIVLGGGYQIYNTQNRDGSVRLWEVHELKKVAEFVRAREPFLKGSKPFADIGVLYSDYDMRNKSDSLFYPGGNDAAKGAVRMILDSAHTCSILMDHMLTPEHLAGKNIIIVPEIKYMRDETKGALLKFAEGGGSLIISGYECCKLFGAGISGGCSERAIAVKHGARYINQYARAADGESFITSEKHGKGSITAVAYNIFEIYCHAPDFYVRNMIADIISGSDRLVEYGGQKFIDIVTAKNNGRLLINLTNTSGIYSEGRLRAYDEIQPLADIEIRVKLDSPPKSVQMQPGNAALRCSYDLQAQKLAVGIDSLHIHAVILIEE